MEREFRLTCLLQIVGLIAAFIIGAISVQYIVWFIWSKEVSFWLAGFLGLLSGELSVVVALVMLILRSAGIA